MLRFAIASLGLSLLMSACDDGPGLRQGRDYSYSPSCSSFTSCQTCTPALGCGWCSYKNGTGSCTSDPSYCNSQPAYSWTWELAWCPATTTTDASALDASVDGASTDTAAQDTAASDSASNDGPAD